MSNLKIFANSNGQLLINHLLACGELALAVCDFLEVDSKIKELTWMAAVLHDIGKVSSLFQRMIELGKDHLLNEEKGVRHNELSYLYFNTQSKLRTIDRNTVARAVYWHHSTYLYEDNLLKRSIKDIFNELKNGVQSEKSTCGESTSEFFRNCNNVIKDVVGKSSQKMDIKLSFDEDAFNDSKYESEKKVLFPFLDYDEDNNLENSQVLLIRQILHYVDRTISKLSVESLSELVMNNSYQDLIPNEVIDNKDFDQSNLDATRLNEQIDIINNVVNQNQPGAFINAPAGFGKTLLGILFAIKLGQKTYWVCPRNAVAESVFESIKSSLNIIGRADISVELYLTGERKDATHNNVSVCGSNIVVTNFDNFLNPTVSHRAMTRLPESLFSTVIFDEYHESRESDESIFAAFHCVSSTRLAFCKKYKTMFLSATHAGIPTLFPISSYNIYPEANKHYGAVHSKIYKKANDISNLKKLTIRNSISNVQEEFKNKEDAFIIHSGYTATDLKSKKTSILNNYGKSGNCKVEVVSGPILKAAMDISFYSLDKSTSSPEDDLQSIGRINRWGRESIAEINLLDMTSDKKESPYIVKFYNKNLARKWFAYWSEIKVEFTLDELYHYYNDFHIKYEEDITKFLQDKLKKSYSKLKDFFPIYKKPISNEKMGVISVGKSLRNSTGNHFILIKDNNGNWLKEAISVEKYIYDEIRELDGQDESHSWTRIVKNLPDNVQSNFDYSQVLKDLKKNKVVKADYHSKNSLTPYPTFNKIYHYTLGIIKK